MDKAATPAQVQPASLDMRLGHVAYRLRASFLTGRGRRVLDRLDDDADRFIDARRNHWEDVDDKGHPLRRTMGIASLGGATIDNEENYFAKKLFTAAGAIQIENQARI